MKPQSEIQRFILSHVARKARAISNLVAKRFGISRQAANRHLARMVEQGLLSAEGQTRSREYRLVVLSQFHDVVPLTRDLEEDALWRDRVLRLLVDTPENVRDICNYGFTEMVNNARDHSGSASVEVSAEVTAATIEMIVADDGIGVFRKIKQAFDLSDERHAVLELSKGKLTTDPTRHTGEGIFFTSRMFDSFVIGSGQLALAYEREGRDFLYDDFPERSGTKVSMTIETASSHTTNEVFDRYATDQDDYAFQRTHVVVALAQAEGEKLISRSQAKRILARLERFKEVMLDFKGIKDIGPAFADEIFRVFHGTHPEVRLLPLNTNEQVAKMIRRAEAARGVIE